MDYDLEKFWRRLRGTLRESPFETTVEPKGKTWDLRGAIVRAARRADAELAEAFKGEDRRLVSKVATAAVQVFLEAWYDELRGGDTVSLIGVVLDGRDLTVEELKGFVAALPVSLLERICEFPGPRASGLQALLAIERERRKGNSPDYLLSRDPLDGKLVVTFYPTAALGRAIVFKLDETFEGVTDPGVISG